MSILSVQSEAVLGVQRGLSDMRKAAAEIANPEELNKAGEGSTLEGSIVDLAQAKTQVQASAKVVSAIDEVIGSIIDLRV